MNRIDLTGYLAREPELRRTGTGKAVVTVDMAVKRPMTKDETDFITIVAWEGTAEFIDRNFHKGSGIEVCGYLTMRPYTDKEGKKRKVPEVIVQTVDFGKSSGTGGSSAGQSNGGNAYGNVSPENFPGYPGTASDFQELDGEDEQLPF